MDSQNSDWTCPAHYKRYKAPRCYDNIVGKPLTDRRIAHYENRGWYGAEAKQARKERAEKRFQKQTRKEPGNFQVVGGRLIYCPI